MLSLDQGNAAKVIDAAAIQLLWRVARGTASAQEVAVAGFFPPLVHLPVHATIHQDPHGTRFSAIGTWDRDNLVDYFAAGPGTSFSSDATRPTWSGAIGMDGPFPAALPTQTGYVGEPLKSYAFVPAEKEMLRPDERYLRDAALWYRREADRRDGDERDREAVLSAARFSELWMDSVSKAVLGTLSAYELEIRTRRMGMVAGDWFAHRFGWAQSLIGVGAVRGFNRLLAWWAAATLMPHPFRVGCLDRCFANNGLCAALLAAGAAAPNFARAAVQRAAAPRDLPVRGAKYVQAKAELPPRGLSVRKIVKQIHGVPVFSPIPGHPQGLWEMYIAVRVERTMKPVVLRQPSPLVMRREQTSIDSIIVRVGDKATDDDDAASITDTFFFGDDVAVADVASDDVGSGLGLNRALAALWRAGR